MRENRTKFLGGLLGILTVTLVTIGAVNPDDVRGRLVHRYRREGLAGLLRSAANRIDDRGWRPTAAAYEFRPLDPVLAWLAEKPSMSIVQIGAYIGDMPNDPLFRFLQSELLKRSVTKLRTKVVLVEPIRRYFDQLVENYAGVPDVAFENLAISEEEEFLEMYTLDADPVEYGFSRVALTAEFAQKEAHGGVVGSA